MFKIFTTREKGITLIEILLVITLIGIMSSVVTGVFSSAIVSFRLKTAASSLLSDLRKAQQLAIIKQQDYVVELISDTDYVIYINGTSEYIIECSLAGGLTATHSRSDQKIVFKPLGTTLPNGTFTITDTEGHYYKVVVSSSGRIRVERWK
jgi:prepilin-type N-terminal cleavage/methylation domain-containing protein